MQGLKTEYLASGEMQELFTSVVFFTMRPEQTEKLGASTEEAMVIRDASESFQWFLFCSPGSINEASFTLLSNSSLFWKKAELLREAQKFF